MAELQTLARPYARAVFELAREKNALKAWSDQLGALAAAVQDSQIAALIGHPRVTRQQLADTLATLLGDALGADGLALVRLLAENGRLKLAPQIAQQFDALRAEAESRVDVEIVSAAVVPPEQQASLKVALGKRLSREVNIDWQTDESLIAGAVIRAGDLVIDGSVSGELARLKNSLSQS